MPGRHGQYPPGLQERAVRLVAECRPDHASEWEAMRSVGQKLGIGTTETVRKRVRRAEVERWRPAGGNQGGVRRAAPAEAEVRALRRERDPQGGGGFLSRPSSTGHTRSSEVRGGARRLHHGRRAALGCRTASRIARFRSSSGYVLVPP